MDEGRYDPTVVPTTESIAIAQNDAEESGVDEGDRSGQVLPGTHYKLERLLGDGGSGQVYRGLHLELDKPVAIKVLHGEVGQSAEYASRFRREAKAASSICHPGVVTVTDFGTADDGRLFLVMELIEGETLAEVIRRGPVGTTRALRIAANLSDVLAAIHAVGIVHRDVKPANVFILDHDEVKVVDFGVARVGALGGADWRITRTGRVVGTPGYMAPEHARAKKVDGRADLYSVGAILYEMLTGLPPFRGDSAVDVLMAQMVHRPDPPSRALRKAARRDSPTGSGSAEKIPRAVDRVVRRLLAVNPSDRYRDAAALKSTLGDILESTGGADGTSLRHRGTTLRVAAAALGLVGLVVGAVYGFFGFGPSFQAAELTATPTEHGGAEDQTSLARAILSPPEHETAREPQPLESLDTADPTPEGAAPPSPESTPSSTSGRRTSRRTGPSTDVEVVTEGAAPGRAGGSERGDTPSDVLESPRVLLQRARIAAASGRYGDAERWYEQAEARGADRAAVLSGLGQVALARAQHVRAARLLEQSIALRPGSNRLRLDLGRAYQGIGQLDRAIEQWRAVLQSDPNNAQARRLLRAVGARVD